MIERFEGEAGRENLLDALRNQKLVVGDGSLAEEIAGAGKLVEVKAGTSIITQGTEDTDVFFILAGAFDVFVHGRKVARRFANDHVGEMAAIQPTQKRSATVTATETSVICQISGTEFNRIGTEVPRSLAAHRKRAGATSRTAQCARSGDAQQDPDLHHFLCGGTGDRANDSERARPRFHGHLVDRWRIPCVVVPG